MSLDIERLSFEAEEKNDLTLLSKANVFRKAKKEKQDVLKTLEITEDKLKEEYKAI